MAKAKKKERKSRINFRSGVKKIHEQMGNDTKITPECVALINNILNDICSRLVESTKNQSEIGKMDANDVNKAMKKIFPKTLANHAAAEGSKIITKFRSGLIRYKPPSTKPKKKVVKRRKMRVIKRSIKKKKVKKSRKRINQAKELLLRRLPIKKITVVELPRAKGSVKVKMHTRRMPSRYKRIDLKKPQKRIVKPKKKVRKIRKVSVKKYTRMVPASYKKRTPKKRVVRKKGVTRKKTVVRKKGVNRKKTVRRKVIKKKSGGTIRFAGGLVALLGQIHPGMKVTPKAMKLVNSAMQSLCTKLIAASQEKAKDRSQVTHENVAAAVRSVLPSTMANHAAAEGSKALTCYAAQVSKGA